VEGACRAERNAPSSCLARSGVQSPEYGFSRECLRDESKGGRWDDEEMVVNKAAGKAWTLER